LSAGLEFHWPGMAHNDDQRPSSEAESAPLYLETDVPSDLEVAGGHSAECKRVLRQALDRIVDLEEQLRAAKQQLSEASGAVDVQRTHIDSLNTKLRQRRSRRGRAPRN